MKRISFLQRLAILVIIGVGAVAMWFLETGCLFKRFLGIPCMSCGMTRAMFAFINGNFAESFALHPMFLSVPILAIMFLFGNKLFKGKSRIPSIIILVVIILGFAVNYILKLCGIYI